MIFNQHSKYEGRHAFLSASKYSWLNYDVDHLKDVFRKSIAAAKGTELHEIAASCIKNGIKLQRSKKTFNQYVNDAIGFRMKPEVVLVYSDNIFGTTDAISFENNFLRIHDLKTGDTPAKFEQLEIYAALFFLEYGRDLNIKPENVGMELRIYQFDSYEVCVPDPREITAIMDKIVEFDGVLNDLIVEEIK